jgi:uncharacterized membrane protein YvlD (DUF360 family)
MTPASGSRPAPNGRGWLAFYRLQGRLRWEWRPTRLAIIRRGVLSLLGTALALAITAGVVPGLQIDGLAPLVLAALLLLAIDSTTAVVLHWLLVGWALFIAQLLGLVVQFVAIVGLGRVLPGIHVGDPTAALWGALLLTVLNSFFAELVAVSDDDSYYSVLVRKLVAREFHSPKEPIPGLLVIQIDGLSLPVLREAIRASRVPILGRLVRDGKATLHPWVAMLPPTTPASQGGILHGNNDGIAGFRWYEKATARLLVANHPEDAAEMVRRISDGKGLLADDGASIGNLMTGDAPRSYLTMATIEKSAPDDDRRMRGFFVTTVNYIRLLVLMAGEVAKELYQAERQRGWNVEPRMHRGVHFAIERAVTNIALRTISTALVIEEMFGGAPTIYVDYTGYDAISHHCGPERIEAIDALEGIDRAIGSLLKAARFTGRPYRVVVLSDHGQCLGATFRQRYGETLEEVIAKQLPATLTVVGTTDAVESGGYGRRIAAELGRGSGLGPLMARHLPSGLRRAGAEAGSGDDAPPPDVVVASSGNLAHVYLTAEPGQMTSDGVEARHPGVIATLARHPGIGAVVGRSAEGHPVLLGASGRADLSARQPDDTDLLAEYGPRAAEALARLVAFPNAGDLILLGAIDPVTDEVTPFEELVGSHGGLGGRQTEPFILSPTTLRVTENPPVGAPALYRQLVAWQAQLRQEQALGDRTS